MKITENFGNEDFAGRYPICSVKGSELYKIYEWLFRNGEYGYKFAIVFDMTKDEFCAPENPKEYMANVQYLDELFEEVVYYMGIDKAQEELNRLKGR